MELTFTVFNYSLCLPLSQCLYCSIFLSKVMSFNLPKFIIGDHVTEAASSNNALGPCPSHKGLISVDQAYLLCSYKCNETEFHDNETEFQDTKNSQRIFTVL